MELKINAQARGVRIISGESAKGRRRLLNELIEIADASGFQEITLPCIEPSEIYINKAGDEILGQMYVFPDKKNRQLCLRPEATATIQLIAEKHLKRKMNQRFWYFERCWRYEKPQENRYREFFQFGMEIINPDSGGARDELIALAERMVSLRTTEYEVAKSVKRGLSYYTSDGFEIAVAKLGAQKQVVGGGAYAQGIGFGVGFDRLFNSGLP